MPWDQYVSLDLHLKELRQAIIHLLGSDPGSPIEGQVWWNTGSHTFKFHDGTAVQIAATQAYVLARKVTDLTAPTTAVPWNSQRLTGVADPTSAQDAATQNYVLTRRLDQFAAPNVDLSLASHKLTNVTDPSTAQDAATKAYVDAAIQTSVTGLNAKASVKAASTANIAIPPGGTTLTVDGITMANGDRVLLKNQSTASQNGIYVVGGIGSSVTLTRSTDADTAAEVQGLYTWVDQGTANQDTGWYQTADAVTLGTTGLTFIKFAGSGGTGARGTQVTGPAGTPTTFAITHNLGTTAVVVSVVKASDNKVATVGVTITDANTVTLDMDGAAFSTNQFIVTILALS